MKLICTLFLCLVQFCCGAQLSFFVTNSSNSRGFLDLSNANIVADGNSLTVGSGSPTSYTEILEGLPPFATNGAQIQNFGVGGQTTPDMIDDYATQIATEYDDEKDNNILLAWEIGNDLSVGETVENSQINFQDYCELAQATGYRVIVFTNNDRNYDGGGVGDFEILNERIDSTNVWLRANYKTFADEIVDLDADSRLARTVFQADSKVNPTYYSDHTHYNTSGYEVIAELVAKSIMRLRVLPP